MAIFLKDTDLIERSAELKNRDNTLWEKIKSYLSDLLDKVRALYSRFTPDSNEGKYVLTMKDSIQKIHEMWINGALSAIENYNKAEIGESTEKKNIKYRAREEILFDKNDKSEAGEILKITSENIKNVPNKEIFNIKRDFVFKSNNKSSDVYNYFKSIGGKATNPEIGIVELNKTGSKSTLFHGFGKEKLASIFGIREVIESGTIINHIENYKNKNYDRYIICGKGTLFGNN